MSGDGLGPLEAGDGTVRTEGGPAGRLARVQRELGSRRRYALLALAVAAGVLLLFRALERDPPARAAPPPVPYPAQVARLTVPAEGRAEGRHLSVAAELRVEGAAPVDLLAVGQPYPGISLSVRGGLPLTAAAGRPLLLRLEYDLTDCSTVPVGVELPYVDVTLRNTRAIQTVSQIPGALYAETLAHWLDSACRSSDIRTAPAETVSPDRGVR
ncbi:Tat pathway signal sequence domain protein [Kitasatospora sp. NPDC051853]|uniref:Tat pathway signal sequence domain protein n=1 Tax=Kitasatospora sp. NPDC051853 TaxID=3364058 RepID=UPI0037A17480